jgi:hypothetical protein
MIKGKVLDIIHKFFINLYGVKIDADLYFVPLKNKRGAYEGSCIYIDNAGNEMDQELAIVHEINHVYQKLGYSVSIPDIYSSIKEDVNIDESCKRIEIDSRIVELLYIYETFGTTGFNLLKNRLYKNCNKFDENLFMCINNMKNGFVKEALIEDVSYEYEKTV